MSLVSVNGVVDACVQPRDRGLAYGDGLFETMRCGDGGIPLWSYHRQRLLRGCRRLAIELDMAAVEQWQQQLLARADNTPGVVKLLVSRGVGTGGYSIDPQARPTVVLSWLPLPPPSEQPLRLYRCRHRLPLNPLLAGIKHLNRLDNVLLKRECDQAGYGEGLVLDSDGHLLEAVSSNLFLVRAGELYTPSLERAGVAGVMREFILAELAPACGLTVHVQSLPVETLGNFESGFLCNSVRGIVPLAGVAADDVSPALTLSPSVVINALQAQLLSSRWHTPVNAGQEKGEC